MKIKVGLTEKSIDAAIKKVEEYQKKFQNFIPMVLRKSAEKVQEMASERLSAVGIGSLIEAQILANWEIDDKEKNRVILKNNSQKATYVEFGVGEVGAGAQHEKASELGYQYDMPSKYKWTNKNGQTHWYISFHSADEIDLPPEYYEQLTMDKYARRSRMYIRTQGQPSTMFLFQAAMDFCDMRLIEPIAKKVIEELGL